LKTKYQVVIVGGGLAGLCSAIHLSKIGISILLIEKHSYPKHKVCGEYISNEVLPYLNELGFDPFHFGATKITNFSLSTTQNRKAETKLPLGGFGISRYCMDEQLAILAQNQGVSIIQETVNQVLFEENLFTVSTLQGSHFSSDFVLGAYGKRSTLDRTLQRKFFRESSPYLGVKAHYKGNFPSDAVGLHNFEGGYCGISKVENDQVNVCYLTDFESFKQHKDIQTFQKEVISQNKVLSEFFDQAEMLFEKPISISQISFSRKSLIENHMIMCGDSAGMIHPLAGNGMSMAIRSSFIAGSLIGKWYEGKIKDRVQLEKMYKKQWSKEFSIRLKYGHIISRLFRLGWFTELLMMGLKIIPWILPYIIKKTHGDLMLVHKILPISKSRLWSKDLT